jgi:D-alanyl-D-alanine carboxypeptidase
MGLKDTKFTNPTGLTDVRNYSTAYEMTKLISFCMNNHLLRSIFKKKVYACTVSNEKMGSNR